MIEILKATILGIIQGITEWLPISSTGHLIIIEDILKFELSPTFVNTFMVVIQLGSILAVIILFFNKLNPFTNKKNNNEKKETINLWFKIALATIPAFIFGFLFEEKIDSLLYNSIVVAAMLIFYGIIFIFIENKSFKPKITEVTKITYKLALGIGLFQTLALIPGTSRSGATIIGAVILGLSRYAAAEFSFFLAIPTMVGASAYKLWQAGLSFTSIELLVLISGFITAFVVSLWAIKFLLDYIKKHDFKVFGYYRIILGIIILVYYAIKVI